MNVKIEVYTNYKDLETCISKWILDCEPIIKDIKFSTHFDSDSNKDVFCVFIYYEET